MSQSSSFSPEEVACFTDTEFFRVKSKITRKVRYLLEELHGKLQSEVQRCELLAPESFNPESVQFVKGEHLEDFPYQYLDFPRHYTREEKFAFRSLFWWGHHVVFSLILEGLNIRRYKENIINNWPTIADKQIHLCLSASLWEWKQGPGYTMELTSDRKSQTAAVLANRTSVKLARFIPMTDSRIQSGLLPEMGHETFRTMLPVILP